MRRFRRYWDLEIRSYQVCRTNERKLAADLNKAKGLSMRKTCAVLRDCFGLQLSPGRLSQALDRLAAKVKPQYDALALELRQAPALHSDETS